MITKVKPSHINDSLCKYINFLTLPLCLKKTHKKPQQNVGLKLRHSSPYSSLRGELNLFHRYAYRQVLLVCLFNYVSLVSFSFVSFVLLCFKFVSHFTGSNRNLKQTYACLFFYTQFKQTVYTRILAKLKLYGNFAET